MRRVLCVYLPAWPLQRLWRDRPELRDKPMAIYDPHAARGPKVLRCFTPRAAGRATVTPGMPLAEARSVEPRLHAQPCDPQGDLDALGRLAEWAGRFSPIVGLEDGPTPESLLLDITGCGPLFHGEQNLLEQAGREFREQGYTPRAAIADTVGAAWALAHYADSCCPVPPGQTEPALMPLPVAALRLPAETVQCLAELGVETVRELAALPRSSLPARFGPMVLERLDQAFGRVPEVITPYRPLPEIEAVCPFEYATDRRDVLDYAVEHLLQGIHAMLRDRDCGARQLECCLHHDGTRPTCIEVGLFRPSRSPRHLGMLLRARLERLQVVEPVSAVRLRVPATAPLDNGQDELFESERSHAPAELASLIDDLSSRLGREAVTTPQLVPDAQPEYACRYEPAIRPEHAASSLDCTSSHTSPTRKRGESSVVPSLARRASVRRGGVACLGASSGLATAEEIPAKRPVRLWPEPVSIPVMSVVPEGPPIQFRWSGVQHQIARSWGPERIETGWWRGRDVHRDYYVVENTAGARFWIFQRRDDGGWFLHGCFD
jgi:protein ImuB